MSLNKLSGSCWTVIAKKDRGRVKGHGPVCKLRAYEAEGIHFTASARVESRETAQSKAAGYSRPKSASKKQTDQFAKFRISLIMFYMILVYLSWLFKIQQLCATLCV